MTSLAAHSSFRLRPALLLAALALAPFAPLAAADAVTEPANATPSPWFADLSAGLSIIPSGDITLGGRKYEGDFKDGPFLRGAVGRRLGKGWAVEGEWFYRTNSVSSLVATDRRFTGGDAASNNFFLNATYSPGEPFAWRGSRPTPAWALVTFRNSTSTSKARTAGSSAPADRRPGSGASVSGRSSDRARTSFSRAAP